MLLADDQNMIQALTPKRSDQAFSGDLGDMGRSRIPIARIALVALYSVLVLLLMPVWATWVSARRGAGGTQIAATYYTNILRC
jgi:hypothetical protein